MIVTHHWCWFWCRGRVGSARKFLLGHLCRLLERFLRECFHFSGTETDAEVAAGAVTETVNATVTGIVTVIETVIGTAIGTVIGTETGTETGTVIGTAIGTATVRGTVTGIGEDAAEREVVAAIASETKITVVVGVV